MAQPCVLLVESDILVRSPLADYLRECGYRVLEAANVGEARQVLSDKTHRVDVVLADINSPGENGFALASWLRRSQPEVQILLAGTIDNAAAKAGELCQEGPAIAKPYDHQIVLDHIKRLMAARDGAK